MRHRIGIMGEDGSLKRADAMSVRSEGVVVCALGAPGRVLDAQGRVDSVLHQLPHPGGRGPPTLARRRRPLPGSDDPGLDIRLDPGGATGHVAMVTERLVPPGGAWVAGQG
jgi:hypothetical protein